MGLVAIATALPACFFLCSIVDPQSIRDCSSVGGADKRRPGRPRRPHRRRRGGGGLGGPSGALRARRGGVHHSWILTLPRLRADAVAPASGAARTRLTAAQVLGSCLAVQQEMPTHC